MTLRSVVERKAPSLPRFVTVPAEALDSWSLDGTTMAEVAIGGVDIGRRALKRWGRDRDVWFFDLTEAQCRSAGIDTGDEVTVRLRRADEGPPAELADLLERDSRARRTWDAWTPGHRRQVAEHVRAAARAATRRRRAERHLLDEGGAGVQGTHPDAEAL